jgi:3-oxoacyl-[acyl-carrier protein] reductase
MNLSGKVAVITGASRGVGRATALALARHGCSIAVNYSRSREEAEQTVAAIHSIGVKAVCFQGDVANEGACREMMAFTVQELGRIHVLVNNAATTEFIPHSRLDDLTDEHWDRLFAVNVKGAFFCARAVKPYMEAAGEGMIVNVSSIAGITAAGSSIAYCASKAALINMTMSLARVFAPRIRVNSVAPGFIASKWTRDGLGSNYDMTKQMKEQQAALGKICEPENVADAIVGLLIGGDMITGQTVVCDGGALIGPKA